MAEARMKEILSVLKREYPDSQCSLIHESPFQLLIATMLSAQCTDERVNQVTPALFQRFPTPEAMAGAKLEAIEALIRSTNFYKNKAKAILQTSRTLVEKYGGQVPRELGQLTELRGVGRKTANVVLGVIFNIPSLVVDTHVGRLSLRMGFTRSKDPVQVEQQLMQLVPKQDWTLLAHLWIDHGRKICTARKAKCEICPLKTLCPKEGL